MHGHKTRAGLCARCVPAALLLALAACGGGTQPGAGDGGVPADPVADSADYRVTFESLWTAGRFPTNFPANDHFSSLIGATHNAQVVFWALGQPASSGIESMAETGATSTLRGEVEAAIGAGAADQVLSGSGLGSAPSSTTLSFTADALYPRLTLVSMLAPSPDWFVGVAGLDLRPGGEWLESLDLPLPLHDAGTDHGPRYASANADANPAGVIDLLSSSPADTDFELGVHRDDAARYAAVFRITRTR